MNSNMEVSEVTDVRLSSTDQTGGADLIAVRAVLDGEPCNHALVDTGASASFVHRRWVAQHKNLRISKRSVPFRVTLADGSSTNVDEVVHVEKLTVYDQSAPCDLIVLARLRYDIVIGLPWLRAAGVTIEFGPVVKWAGRPVTVTSARDAKEATRQLLATAALDREYGNRVQRLLAKYASVFAKQLPKRVETAFSRSFAYELKLEPDVLPIVERERRRSPEDIKVMIDTVTEMEAAGMVEDSESSWSSQVVLVKKKDGTKRMAIDYRRLNASTIPITEPIPLPEVMFAHLRGARIFSKMDLLKGFWQIPVKEGSRPYLAFATPLGLKQPTRMPFGIRNAPAVFQREMQRVLKDRLYKGVMVYIDDILIYSATANEHDELVEWVLQRLQAEGYYAHPDKCEFFRHEVEFLGHVISAAGVAVQQHKVQRVREWLVPQTKRDVKSFLGMTGYYRKFIQSYSRVAVPLTDLTADDAKWAWGDEHERAFRLLKHALCKAPVLAHADATQPYVIQTDASAFAIGGFLAQHQPDDSLRPIAYWSRKLNGAETRYSATERELLALVEAVDEWRVYVEGSPHPVLLRSDHRPLVWLNNKPELSSRLFRWIERLDGHSFRIEHVAGKGNSVADALSRRADMNTSVDEPSGADIETGSRIRVELAAVSSRRRMPNSAVPPMVTRSRAKRVDQLQPASPPAEEQKLPVAETTEPAPAESSRDIEEPGMQRQSEAQLVRWDEMSFALMAKYEGQDHGLLKMQELTTLTYKRGRCTDLPKYETEFDRLALLVYGPNMQFAVVDQLLGQAFSSGIQRGDRQLYESMIPVGSNMPVTLQEWKARAESAMVRSQALKLGSTDSTRSTAAGHAAQLHNTEASDESKSAVLEQLAPFTSQSAVDELTTKLLVIMQAQKPKAKRFGGKSGAGSKKYQLTADERNKLFTAKRCFCCYKPGHQSRDCTQKATLPTRAPTADELKAQAGLLSEKSRPG